MLISRLSLFRHRITTSFQTCNNNLLLHHGLPRYIGVRFFGSRRNNKDILRKYQIKAKESVDNASDLSLDDDHPPLLYNEAIGMVAAAQANFMRVFVEESATQNPRVGVELLCVVRALLKKVQRRVLVGDKVLVGSIDWVDRRGVIENVFQRKSQVLNPSVANVDHLLVLFSFVQPKLEALSVNRFLVEAEYLNIPLSLALNKVELVDQETERAWRDRLRGWGYEPIICSVESERGLDSLEYLMKDQTTVIVGPSGVGKSSLINALRSKQHVSDTELGIIPLEQIKDSKLLKDQRVGEVSTRNGRGKHTTRNVSLLPISGGGYLADTPGFNQPSLLRATKKSLALMFPEIRKVLSGPAECEIEDCLHLAGAEGCVVTGDWDRYPYYVLLLNEINIREGTSVTVTGTKRNWREGDVRCTIGYNGTEPLSVVRKYRRPSRKSKKQSLLNELKEETYRRPRKSMKQSLLDELEEEQDDGDDKANLGDV